MEEPDDAGGAEEKKVEVPVSEGFAKFNERFSAKRNAPPELGGDVNSETNQKVVDQKIADGEKKEEAKQASEEESKKVDEQGRKERKGPGSNVPKIIEDKKAAEMRVQELEIKIPEYETRIAELQKTIESGKLTAKKEQELESRVTELQAKLETEKDALVNENKRLSSRVSYYDIQENPEFQNQYIHPVVESYNEAADVIGSDDKKLSLLNRAVLANSSSLRANTKEERQALENERDTILSSIAEDMPNFSGQRFSAAMGGYISRSKKLVVALNENEITKVELTKQAQERQEREYASRIDSWDKTYKSLESAYTDDEKLNDDEVKLSKELGLDVEDMLKESAKVAKGALNGSAKMQDAVEILHRGRLYPVMQAKITIRDQMLKEKDELIAKLRAGGTGDSGTALGQKREESKPASREDWQKKFSASRVK